MRRHIRSIAVWQGLALLAMLGVLMPGAARAGTLVTFNTNMGTIQVDLFDDVVDQTVDNFLTYVGAGTYSDTIIHRSPPNFVIQGGGFKKDFSPVATNPAIPLDYQIQNTRGTIAMARTGDPNSAQSGWFINVKDNSVGPNSLEPGGVDPYGYTVFGWVVNGMDVVDAINAVQIYNAGQPFGELPLKDYNPQNQVTDANKIIINSISIAETHPSFQNPLWHVDTNNDGNLNGADALLIINDLLDVQAPHDAAGSYIGNRYEYFDPNGDGRVNSKDLLMVFNAMLAGEQPPAGPLTASPLAAPLAIVPEPASWLLLAFAAMAMTTLGYRRRARRGN